MRCDHSAVVLASRRAALPCVFTDPPRATVWVHARRPRLAIGAATRTASREDGGEPLVCSWRARVPVAATRRLAFQGLLAPDRRPAILNSRSRAPGRRAPRSGR